VQERTGTYQIHVTSTGKEGAPNELAATRGGVQEKCNGGLGCLALVILRLYTAESRGAAPTAMDPARLWGYVPKPEVSLRYGQRVGQWTGLTWEAYHKLPECDPHKKTVAQSYLDRKVAGLKGDFPPQPLDNQDNNFVVFRSGQSERALFPNADANYLFATARNARVDEGLQLVARIEGRLPTTARGLETAPYIAERLSYEARYVSLSTVALRGGGPVIDTVVDVEMERKYAAQESTWGRRRFSAVAGPSVELLRACPKAIFDPERDVFLTTAERDTRAGQPASYQGFIYRQILSRWQVSGRRDKSSVALAKQECSGLRGKNVCQLRSFFEEAMGSYYPRIRYFYCGWSQGGAACRCEAMDGTPVGQDWTMFESQLGKDDDEVVNASAKAHVGNGTAAVGANRTVGGEVRVNSTAAGEGANGTMLGTGQGALGGASAGNITAPATLAGPLSNVTDDVTARNATSAPRNVSGLTIDSNSSLAVNTTLQAGTREAAQNTTAVVSETTNMTLIESQEAKIVEPLADTGPGSGVSVGDQMEGHSAHEAVAEVEGSGGEWVGESGDVVLADKSAGEWEEDEDWDEYWEWEGHEEEDYHDDRDHVYDDHDY
jgi:hypothetical protein